jgi:hypothetical protein
MSKIIRHEFMGSRALFWLLCVTGVGLPLAILYLVEGTIHIESEVADAEEFVAQFRAGKLKSR